MKKFLLIAVIVIIVIVIAFIIFFATKGKQFMEMAVDRGFGTMETMMIANRPASIPEDSIRTIVGHTIDMMKLGAMERHQMQGLMTTFRECMDDKQIDSLEVVMLLEEMNKLQ